MAGLWQSLFLVDGPENIFPLCHHMAFPLSKAESKRERRDISFKIGADAESEIQITELSQLLHQHPLNYCELQRDPLCTCDVVRLCFVHSRHWFKNLCELFNVDRLHYIKTYARVHMCVYTHIYLNRSHSNHKSLLSRLKLSISLASVRFFKFI